jgi:UDPglucose--hexose-1-phosphate uridylyltransferase
MKSRKKGAVGRIAAERSAIGAGRCPAYDVSWIASRPMPIQRELPHRRFNPLTREWVLVSPQRTDRPWQGAHEPQPDACLPAYDPACCLCPGNARANGELNPPYLATFAFDNDFPALRLDTPEGELDEAGLLVARAETGACRVICYSPRHDLALPRMAQAEVAKVVAAWTEEYRRLGARDAVASVQIFENRGAMMGTSNPHPHGQIWATRTLPNALATEAQAQSDHRGGHASCLLCDYLAVEERMAERIVCANDDFVALVPFWAVWPYETMILSRRHLGALDELLSHEAEALADILRRVTIRYDNLFAMPFPYSMGFHQRPTDGAAHPYWHFHAHFYPPLLRSASVRKFMVGFEMLAMPQRDITAESAAERLRDLSEVHFGERSL